MGQPVPLNARVDIDRQAERQQRQQVTILISKPVGYVSVGRKTDMSPPWRWCNRKTAGANAATACAGASSSCGLLNRPAGHRLDRAAGADRRTAVARQPSEDSDIEKCLVRVSYGRVKR
jgi:23S rRNA pseudouridine2604 synthase